MVLFAELGWISCIFTIVKGKRSNEKFTKTEIGQFSLALAKRTRKSTQVHAKRFYNERLLAINLCQLASTCDQTKRKLNASPKLASTCEGFRLETLRAWSFKDDFRYPIEFRQSVVSEVLFLCLLLADLQQRMEACFTLLGLIPFLWIMQIWELKATIRQSSKNLAN